MAKTASGLVEYAAVQLGTPYWYGTFGQTADNDLLEAKSKQYPKYYTPARMPRYRKDFGKKVFDCVGLVKGYLWSSSPFSEPVYNASQDVSSNGMRSICRENGTISTLPEIPGILVFSNGHMGVYAGSGNVIEARGFNYGVVRTNLRSRGWTSWGKCPWIDYGETVKYFVKYTGNSPSIVDALDSIGEDSSFSYRKEIAAVNDIKSYSGTPAQNITMLNLLKNGNLIKP